MNPNDDRASNDVLSGVTRHGTRNGISADLYPANVRTQNKKRLLIFVVAYNAERTIQDVLKRIPFCLTAYETEILIIDDSSKDRTFEKARMLANGELPFPLTVLFNPVNQGYGGNQKIGFHYAIRNHFDLVALIHGDGQYAPECLPDLLRPLINEDAAAVFGSRMIRPRDALTGGMPLYKYVGNRILTTVQNCLLRCSLSEFHSGYRLYSVQALQEIPFDLNTNDFHFDTEIIIQFLRAGLRIKELPIPTYYGDEICYVNGLKYAVHVVRTTLISRAQDCAILYERKFDVRRDVFNGGYQGKLGYESPHSLVMGRVPPRAAVLDIGCASGYVGRALKSKGCSVTGIDQYPITDPSTVDRFIRHDMDQATLPIDVSEFDHVLLLDVVEHLKAPERFVEMLRTSIRGNKDTVVIVSTGNVGFIVTRLMLLFGCFNYGIRGILDLTHTRLFTFSTLRKLFEQAGYTIEEMRGVPAPFPLALGSNCFSRFLIKVNMVLIRLWRSLFAYQIFMVAKTLPTLDRLLRAANEHSRERVRTIERQAAVVSVGR